MAYQALTPQRHKDLQVMQTQCAVWDSTVDVTGKILFTLPAGALVHAAASQVAFPTTWTGTTPALAIGTNATGGALVTNSILTTADANAGTAGIVSCVPATLTAGALNKPLVDDTDVIATVTGTAVVGKVYVSVSYSMPRSTHW